MAAHTTQALYNIREFIYTTQLYQYGGVHQYLGVLINQENFTKEVNTGWYSITRLTLHQLDHLLTIMGYIPPAHIHSWLGHAAKIKDLEELLSEQLEVLNVYTSKTNFKKITKDIQTTINSITTTLTKITKEITYVLNN